ncbi:MAG: zinc ribbon domain-containing protein [Oscillospiraceae bacterium]|nr:zinc ribbon domain-containing protein [Oscillospiraceae bacterium]
MNCTNCGKELTREVKFCDGCGTPVVSEQNNNPAQAQPAPAQSAPVNQEVQENKAIFILSYILFFLPLVSCPDSKIGRFHANQGLVLLITSVAGQIAVTILSSVLLSISWGLWAITSLIGWGWAIVVLALVIIGMVNANKGEQKPLPIIGKFKIIK